MKTKEYKVKVIPFGSLKDVDEGIIYISEEDETSISANFICPCGCGLQTYLPFGESNNEGGDGPRTLTWHEKDILLSISPSIQVRGGCNSHYHIKFNQVL